MSLSSLSPLWGPNKQNPGGRYQRPRGMANLREQVDVPQSRDLNPSRVLPPHLTAAEKQVQRKQRIRRAQNDLGEVVYYFRYQGATAIKIGYTNELVRRVKNLGGTLDDVLAIEPGSAVLERARHEQFAPLRIVSEFFRPEPDLLAHINALRGKVHMSPIVQ